MKKPLAEVMSHVAAKERYRLDPENAVPWENMSDKAIALEMGVMVEVVRALGLLGWSAENTEEGVKVTRRSKKVPEDVKISPTDIGPSKNSSKAKQMGYTGIPCEVCGSFNTVRIGKCLRCDACNHAGECG